MAGNRRMVSRLAACVLSAGSMLALSGLCALTAQASPSSPARMVPQNQRPANWSALPASWHGYAPRTATPNAYCTGASVVYNRHSGKVLEVYGSGTGNGANVDQWAYNGSATQHWCFFEVGQDAGSIPVYEVVNNNSGKCLDLNHGTTANGANIDQWTCIGALNEEWAAFVVNGSYMFAPNTVANSNKGWLYVMEVHGAVTANGGNVDLWTSIDATNEEWCSGPCS